MTSDDDPNKRYYHDIVCDMDGGCGKVIRRVYSDKPIELAKPIVKFDKGKRLYTDFRDIKTWKLLTTIKPGGSIYSVCGWHE